jgi:chemotaxis protein histidine kinase CheA
MNFYANEHTLPRQIEVNVDKEDRHFELDWAPIEDQDMTVSKMMVSIRDVTELHAAQSEAKEREHELEIIGQILKLSAAKFQNFMESAFHSIDCCRMIINESNPKEEWHVILRYIHTIKGNSRTYGFEEITQTVHVAEDFLFSCDRENLSDEDLKETCRQLDNIEKILEHYKYINDTKLERSEVGETENTIIEMAKMFKRLAKDGTLANIPFQSSDAKLIKKVESLSQGSFRAAIGPIVESLPSLANQLNKKTPSIIFQGDDFEIEKQFASKYENIFVHLIRNSMDHAFLPHQDGEIVIDIQNHGGNRRIVYHDNGRGLNLKKLKAKGLEHGLIDEQASDDEIANLIFHSGISSADKVTDISGRGVGMDAVKAFLANLGGNISIELLGLSPDSGYRCFRLNLDIPAPETVALDMAS